MVHTTVVSKYDDDRSTLRASITILIIIVARSDLCSPGTCASFPGLCSATSIEMMILVLNKPPSTSIQGSTIPQTAPCAYPALRVSDAARARCGSDLGACSFYVTIRRAAPVLA